MTEPQTPHSRPRLEIIQSRHGNCARVELHGELDLSSAAELEHQLLALITSEIEQIVVDLRNLDFMDSTGLSVLIRLRQAAGTSSTRLRLRDGNERIRGLFERSGTLDQFQFDDTDR